MARKDQVRELRRKYERDTFGSGGRTAVGADGKASAGYLAYLENFVAERLVPLKVTTKPRYEQQSLFGKNKFEKVIGRKAT